MTKKNIYTVTKLLGIKTSHEWQGWVMASCPFAQWTHESKSDRTASFGMKVNDAGLSGFHCFGCKKKGRMSGLGRILAHYSDDPEIYAMGLRIDALETDEVFPSYEDRGVAIARDRPSPLDEAIYSGLYIPAWRDEYCSAYLKARGVSLRTAKLLGLVCDPEEERVLFPIRGTDNRLYGFSGRTILEPEDYPTHRYPRLRNYNFTKEWQILGAQLLDPEKPIAVVEGLFAYAHFVEIGVRKYANVVATLGSSMSTMQADTLIEHDKPVYMFYDNDKAGRQGIFGTKDKYGNYKHDGAGALLSSNIPTLIPVYPEETGDPDDLDIDSVLGMMNGAELYHRNMT